MADPGTSLDSHPFLPAMPPSLKQQHRLLQVQEEDEADGDEEGEEQAPPQHDRGAARAAAATAAAASSGASPSIARSSHSFPRSKIISQSASSNTFPIAPPPPPPPPPPPAPPPSSSPFPLQRALLSSAGRLRCGPSTPVPSWKMFENPFYDAMAAAVAQHQQSQPGGVGGGSRRSTVSARKLAATLWELQEIPLSRGAAPTKIREEPQEQQLQNHQQQQSHHQQQQNQQQPPELPRSLSGKRTAGQLVHALSPASSHVSHRSLRRSSIQYKLGEGAKRPPHSTGQASTAHSQVLRLLERHTGATPAQITHPRSGNSREIEADDRAITPSNSVLDLKAIPGNPGYGPTTSSELLKVLNRIWSLEEQHTSSMSMVAALRSELERAHALVQELTAEQKSHRKEVENLTRRLADEKAVCREQQQEAVRAAVQSIKEELEDEGKSKRKLEILHRKVARELPEVKKSLGKALQDLERERKARELMEDVCDELAREIGEDKAQVEELKRESAKVREEVEEERKMLQMAEVWREERVQMKLAEARLELEEKNTALDKLRSELEAFLKAKRAWDARDEGSRTKNVKESEMRRNSVDLVHFNEARATGRNLVDSVNSNEVKVQGRTSVDSVQVNEARASTNTSQELDDEGSVDDDLHSIELNNESFGGHTGGSQWGYHSVSQHESESKGRLSTDKGISTVERVDKGKQGQGGKQGPERTRSSQLDAAIAAAESREKDGKWDYRPDSQWIERSIERGEFKDWNGEKRLSVDAKEEPNSPWQSDYEESQDRINMGSRAKGRNLQARSDNLVRSGGTPAEFAGSKHEADVNSELYGSNAAWPRSLGSSRDLRAVSGFNPMQQSSHVASSPTRQWSHYWSSPDPGSPRLARATKASNDLVKGVRDNSLKTKLLEAKLEGQQVRLRSGKGL